MGHHPPPASLPRPVRLPRPALVAQAPPAPAPLQFEVDEGLNQNLFFQSPEDACHAVVTTSQRPRILLTFPAGNSGLGLWADPQANPDLTLSAQGPLVETPAGVRLVVRTNQASLAFTQVVLDSIRAIRDNDGDASAIRKKFVESLKAPADWATPQIEVQETGGAQAAPTVVEIRRHELDGRPWLLRLELSPETRVSWAGDHTIEDNGHLASPLLLSNPPGHPLQFTLTGHIPFKPLTPRPLDALVRPDVVARVHGSGPDATRFDRSLRDLHMLSYREKYLAGSWRFETYFGRDTLLSIAMLSDVLTPGAYVDGLDSVLARLSPEGVVAHEEDVGARAETDNLHAMDEGGPAPPDLETPTYDYKMVDSDFLLPLGESKLPAPELRRFLHGPRLTAVLRNWNRVVAQACYDLVRLNPGFSAGDWRDSGIGLGGGLYPGDVNHTLVPYALRVIRWGLHVDPTLLPSIHQIARQQGFSALEQATAPGVLDALIDRWNGVRRQFQVRLTEAEARRRVAAYLASLPTDQKDALGATSLYGGVTVADWLSGRSVPDLQSGVRFWALSLAADQRPVEVLNSDGAFTLYFSNPPADEVADIVRMSSLPFPVGLMTDAGMVVANPAYTKSPELWKHLDRDAYHGTVIWGWQHNLMALGLMRQMARFRHDPHQAALVASMGRLLQQLQAAEARVGPMANSELWTWDVQNGRIVPLAFGVRSSSDDESNALQLWSAAYVGVSMARHRAGLP